jgi:hypothetical protein
LCTSLGGKKTTPMPMSDDIRIPDYGNANGDKKHLTG